MNQPQPSISELASFLRRPDIRSYFEIHPNQLTSASFQSPDFWSSWWQWAASNEEDGGCLDNCSDTRIPKWLSIWRYYCDVGNRSAPSESSVQDSSHHSVLPPAMRTLVEDAKSLSLPRIAKFDRPCSQRKRPRNTNGMSPKKEHEVERMSEFISYLLEELDVSGGNDALESGSIRHVVDVGAGQAYLSRALRDDLGLHVLALDWSDVQSRGAAKKERKTRNRITKQSIGSRDPEKDDEEAAPPDVSLPRGRDGELTSSSLSYRTVDITSETLIRSAGDWFSSVHASDSGQGKGSTLPSPVLFVALHACGSLTLDIFRAFVATHREASAGLGWKPRAAVIVGCCYNMLRSEDRVLSSVLSGGLVLSPNHLQLAAQTPDQWGTTSDKLAEAKLAIRKVAWRALLEGMLAQLNSSGDAAAASASGSDREADRPKRLGRLNDAVYADWDTFISVAQQKLDVCFNESLSDPRTRAVMESRVGVFHALRCILGPVVESFILLDRKRYLQDSLCATDSAYDVDLVNLFDQSSGSGRNVAIVVKPRRGNALE